MTEVIEHAYRPSGAAKELFLSRDTEILIEGPAGTGKSRAVCEYVNYLCESYAGIRVAMLRQTRKSLTESVLVTFEEKVLWPGHPAITGDATRANRHSYTYPNGSHIVVGGLDHPERLFSTEFDVIAVFEAVECSLDAWEKLSRALRNGVLPWQQKIADTNPGPQSHWLNQRAARGQMKRLLSRHRDNPSLSEAYLEALALLTGARRARLYLGLWVSEEGQVWEEFDASIHMVNEDEVPGIKWTFGAMDWGFRNPGCFQVWGVDGDKRMYRLAEVYKTQKQLDWWAARVVELQAEFEMRAIVCDPSRPENIGFLNDRLGEMRGRAVDRIARGADNKHHAEADMGGLDLVRYGLRPKDGSPPRLFFVRDALRYGRDEELAERAQPLNTEEEIPSYVWLKTEDGQPIREKTDPLSADHGCDSTRYAACFLWKRDLTPPARPKSFPPGTFGDVLGHGPIIDELGD